MRIISKYSLFIGIVVASAACCQAVSATEWTTVSLPPQTLSLQLFSPAMTLAKVPRNLDSTPLPAFKTRLNPTTMFYLALLILGSIGASIGLYFKRVSDQNNIRQMLHGPIDSSNDDWSITRV